MSRVDSSSAFRTSTTTRSMTDGPALSDDLRYRSSPAQTTKAPNRNRFGAFVLRVLSQNYSSGGKGTRTPNPLLAKQMRYQLRHTPEMGSHPHTESVCSDHSAWAPWLRCRHPKNTPSPTTVRPLRIHLLMILLERKSCCDRTWAYLDLNQGPLRYQRSALTA